MITESIRLHLEAHSSPRTSDISIILLTKTVPSL